MIDPFDWSAPLVVGKGRNIAHCPRVAERWSSRPICHPSAAPCGRRGAIAYLPGYVKARVHLAEIYVSQDKTEDAEALLLPALSSRDPEVQWCLADVLIVQERSEEAEMQLQAARLGFEELLGRHLLAFADHAAEFLRRQRRRQAAGDRTRARERRESSHTPGCQAGLLDRRMSKGSTDANQQTLGDHGARRRNRSINCGLRRGHCHAATIDIPRDRRAIPARALLWQK